MALVPDREAGRAICAGPPLDFSFKELRASVQIETEEPRSGVKRSSAPAKEEAGQEAGASEKAPAKETTAGNNSSGLDRKVVIRKITTCVKLNNNMLETLNGLEAALESAMYSPLQNLQWLDVSFNSLSSVDAELLKFVQLKALYLHGNCIAKFGSIQRLQKLPKLLSLTINGNPIQSNRIYRTYILGVVPQIRALDHTSVTSEEANEAASWYRGHVRRMEVRKEQLRELRDQE
mmetsp:Transcript_60184/g.131836  ORF Transcript_60184/g.131836 Transcript_60184/m.131836 type:complete len:234 (+) Transcript_60184:55-756(+)